MEWMPLHIHSVKGKRAPYLGSESPWLTKKHAEVTYYFSKCFIRKKLNEVKNVCTYSGNNGQFGD